MTTTVHHSTKHFQIKLEEDAAAAMFGKNVSKQEMDNFVN